MEKPIGTFYCPCCNKYWDGSKLWFDNTLGAMGAWTCGNILCGCCVQEVKIEKWEKSRKYVSSNLKK